MQTLPGATPLLRKIYPFSKIALSFDPMMGFDILKDLECPKPVEHSLFYDWMHHSVKYLEVFLLVFKGPENPPL